MIFTPISHPGKKPIPKRPRFGQIIATATQEPQGPGKPGHKDHVTIADGKKLVVKTTPEGRYKLDTDDGPDLRELFASRAYTSLQIHHIDGGSQLIASHSKLDVENAEGDTTSLQADNGGEITVEKLHVDGCHPQPVQCPTLPEVEAPVDLLRVTPQQAEQSSFLTQIHNFHRAANILKLSESAKEMLLTPSRAMTVEVPVMMDSGELNVFKGYRVQYDSDRGGPNKGGIRFAPDVDDKEVEALSFAMRAKTFGLPLGGGKGGVICDPKKLSLGELERITREYTRELGDFIGPDTDVPAPDMGSTAQMMDWIRDEYAKRHPNRTDSLAVVTGKPVGKGGSLGRESATGLGGFYILKEMYKDRPGGLKGVEVAVQGFGNVASFIAEALVDEGAKLVTVSDSQSGVYKPEGFTREDLEKLKGHKNQNKTLKGFPGVQHISNAQLLELPVEVLVPAAKEMVITGKNAANVQAKVILECANGPLSSAADDILEKKGALVVPDIIANAGGVVVSYFEWVQNKKNESWSVEKINHNLEKIMLERYNAVKNYGEDRHIGRMRDAANVFSLVDVIRHMQDSRSIDFHVPANYRTEPFVSQVEDFPSAESAATPKNPGIKANS